MYYGDGGDLAGTEALARKIHGLDTGAEVEVLLARRHGDQIGFDLPAGAILGIHGCRSVWTTSRSSSPWRIFFKA